MQGALETLRAPLDPDILADLSGHSDYSPMADFPISWRGTLLEAHFMDVLANVNGTLSGQCLAMTGCPLPPPLFS